jgi:hypoxanthine phosphoribosyltransferase
VDHEVLTWERYGQAAAALADAIRADGYRPDLVLAIARGGLIIAGSLTYALAVKNVHVINVEYYTGIGERLDFPVILPPPLNLVDLGQARLLIADDVADTGHTLQLVRDFCAPQVGEVRCAVLYQKPASVIDPEYVWQETDRWIDFPWSTFVDQAPASPSPS